MPDKIDVGFMTYADLEPLSNEQVTAEALVLINNNLCKLVNAVEAIETRLGKGIDVNIHHKTI